MNRLTKIFLSLLASVLIAGQAFAATTYTAATAATTINPRTCDNAVCSVSATYALTAAFVINDVVKMVRVPAGAMIQEVILSSDDLDSNGGPALVYQVGDTASATRFIDNCLAGQVAANFVVCRTNQQAGNGYVESAEDTINVKVSTAPATGVASGNIYLTVFYTMQGTPA